MDTPGVLLLLLLAATLLSGSLLALAQTATTQPAAPQSAICDNKPDTLDQPDQSQPFALKSAPPSVDLQAAAGTNRPRIRRRPKSSSALPEFSSPIANVTAVLGRDVRLVCTVENLGQYQVAWFKEETKTILSISTNIIITNYRIFLIPDEEERKWVLHINDVQESDRGFYQCKVNTSPMRSTSGYLEVLVPPTIIESQTSQVAEVNERSNVSIQCKANGHPRASISWRRDDGAPIRLSGAGLAEGGGDDSSGAQMSTTTTSGRDQSTGSGRIDSAQLERQQSQATAAATFNGGGSRASILSQQLNDVKSDKLSLYDVDRSMAGIYVCTASNGVPTNAIQRIPLYVKFAPKTSVQRQHISVSLGDQLEMDCLIEAFPKPNSYWSKRSTGPHRAADVDLDRWWWQQLQQPQQQRDRPDGSSRALSYKSKEQTGDPPTLVPSSESSQSDPAADRRSMVSLTSAVDYVHFGRHAHRTRSLSTADYNNPESADDNQPAGHRNQQQISSPAAESSSSKAGDGAGEPKAYVSVRQTAVNFYTYRLRLTIAKMQPDDYGQYSCIAANSMGTSETLVLVTRMDRAVEKSRLPQQTNSDEGVAVDEKEYQRDSLDFNNPYIQQQQQQQQQPTGTRNRNGNRVTYDENYLQAIKTRQNNLVSSTIRSQQKLKLRQSSDRNAAQSSHRTTLSGLACMMIMAITSAAMWATASDRAGGQELRCANF